MSQHLETLVAMISCQIWDHFQVDTIFGNLQRPSIGRIGYYFTYFKFSYFYMKPKYQTKNIKQVVLILATQLKSNSKLRKYVEELPLICIQCLVSFIFPNSSRFLEGRGNLEIIKLPKNRCFQITHKIQLDWLLKSACFDKDFQVFTTYSFGS